MNFVIVMPPGVEQMALIIVPSGVEHIAYGIMEMFPTHWYRLSQVMCGNMCSCAIFINLYFLTEYCFMTD